MIRVGCAGWSLPRAVQPRFGDGTSHLARYATRLPVVEIDSAFHRPHRRAVYERWAAAVPADFAFSVKLPRTITHERRLADCVEPLAEFLEQVAGLGERLACLLVQLPPSLACDPAVAPHFLELLRSQYAGQVALEPRHPSWFAPATDALLRELRIARVLADPVRHDAGRAPGGWPGFVYLRLHGTPRVYYSAYEAPLLRALAARLRQADAEGVEAWCIFDNTAAGAAPANALDLQDLLSRT